MIQRILRFFTGFSFKRVGIYAGIGLVVLLILNSICSNIQRSSAIRTAEKAKAKYSKVLQGKDIQIEKLTGEIEKKQKTVDEIRVEMREIAQKPTKRIVIVKYKEREIDGNLWVKRDKFLYIQALYQTEHENFLKYREKSSVLFKSLEDAIENERALWLKKEGEYKKKIAYLQAFNKELQGAISKLSQPKGLFKFLGDWKVFYGVNYGFTIRDRKIDDVISIGIGIGKGI